MILPVLGIDIAKLKFNVCLINSEDKLKHKVFPNTPDGFTQLVAWLAKLNVVRVHACMEATGAYGEALALFLHAASHTVSVVNPAAIKSFAGSRPLAHQDGQSRCRVDRTLLCGTSTFDVDAARCGSAPIAGACPTLRRALRGCLRS
jgi:hypothetical protein